MGENNSSDCRVAPIFDALLRRDATGASWLPRLLTLGTRPDAARALEPWDLGHPIERAWGDDEQPLAAPKALLSWLVDNLREPSLIPDDDRSDAAKHRRALFRGDAATVTDAHSRLARSSGKGWYIFEGPSYPDAFIETPNALVVVEGKYTEPTPTTSTSWMKTRHQMLRHMDAAWEQRKGKAVLGLLLVEGREPNVLEPPEPWASYSNLLAHREGVAESLPHRSEEERSSILGGFLGVATWQRVCKEFELDFPPLRVARKRRSRTRRGKRENMRVPFPSAMAHFAEVRATRRMTGVIGELVNLFALGNIDPAVVDDVIRRHGAKDEPWFRREAVDLVLEYMERQVESEFPEENWLPTARALRACLRIPDGDFVTLRRGRVANLLNEQLSRILADGEISTSEELLQVDLQAALGIGYDDYLSLTRSTIEEAFLALQQQMGRPRDDSELLRVKLRALEPMYLLATSFRRP